MQSGKEAESASILRADMSAPGREESEKPLSGVVKFAER